MKRNKPRAKQKPRPVHETGGVPGNPPHVEGAQDWIEWCAKVADAYARQFNAVEQRGIAASGRGEVPRRSHEFACWIGADTMRELIGHLYELAHRIERDEMSAGVSGGYGSGSVYAYRHDPNQTHDSYFAELEKHLERLSSPAPGERTESRPGQGGQLTLMCAMCGAQRAVNVDLDNFTADRSLKSLIQERLPQNWTAQQNGGNLDLYCCKRCALRAGSAAAFSWAQRREQISDCEGLTPQPKGRRND